MTNITACETGGCPSPRFCQQAMAAVGTIQCRATRVQHVHASHPRHLSSFNRSESNPHHLYNSPAVEPRGSHPHSLLPNSRSFKDQAHADQKFRLRRKPLSTKGPHRQILPPSRTWQTAHTGPRNTLLSVFISVVYMEWQKTNEVAEVRFSLLRG